jgi:glucosyl-dolichyl phosphate glucuronosyltransferase
LNNTQLSIVICTYNRINLLNLAIKSLCSQTCSREIFEVIIVDNEERPNTEIKTLVNNVRDIINISYIHEWQTGLSIARNRGGMQAEGNYVGYMDDDSKAATDYVQKAVEIIELYGPDFFGGPYYPYYTNVKPEWFKDEYETGRSANRTKYLNNSEFLSGTNMIFKKSLLESLKWFDNSFGMKGNDMAFGEDTAFQAKAWKSIENLKVYYSTDLIVFHLVRSNKLKLTYRFLKKYNIGKSQAYIWIEEEQIRNIVRNGPIVLLKTIVLMLIKGLPGILVHNRKKFPSWKNYAYESFSHYFASIGQEWRYTRDLLRPKKSIGL